MPHGARVSSSSQFASHRWRCPSCRCAARRERACRSTSARRTSAASLSGPSGTEPRYLVNTKHMAFRQTGLWQSARCQKLPEPSWTCEKHDRSRGRTPLLFYLIAAWSLELWEDRFTDSWASRYHHEIVRIIMHEMSYYLIKENCIHLPVDIQNRNLNVGVKTFLFYFVRGFYTGNFGYLSFLSLHKSENTVNRQNEKIHFHHVF